MFPFRANIKGAHKVGHQSTCQHKINLNCECIIIYEITFTTLFILLCYLVLTEVSLHGPTN